MGIDRIGKGSAPPPSVPKEGVAPADRAERADKAFQVRPERAAEASRAAAVAPTAGPTPLERLRAGEIDVDGYVDLKVDQATAHLHGLRPQELDAIRATLRSQMANDPALAELVQQATGSTPTRRE